MRGRTDAIDTHPRRFRRITRVCGTLAANSGEVRQISVEASMYPSMLGAGKGRLDRGRSPDETPSAPEAAGARGEWVARVAVHVRNIALLRTPSVPISNCKSPNLDAQRLASATPHPVPWGRGDALQSLLRSFWRAWRRSVAMACLTSPQRVHSALLTRATLRSHHGSASMAFVRVAVRRDSSSSSGCTSQIWVCPKIIAFLPIRTSTSICCNQAGEF